MLTQSEFEAMIADASKRIEGDISWREDEDHSPAVEFRVEVLSNAGHPLTLKGSYNPLSGSLSYTLIHRAAGRIYALDMGKDHRNPSGVLVGEKHKHRWKERYRDKEAYVPDDITAPLTQPVQVWSQFCAEAKITHRGMLHQPPSASEMDPFS
ncbi:DUF6978 family protein [Polyangium fumosum]|uniref:Uncharacterized protein n=1 Tax=Polyangium fumosum TaxID=889272 RepID=A0A4U1IYP6_9BACT|nr:hypothetical protein [Polyangium fumosum]TKC99678.1 hypothetical protein E8A74_36980 [Polyangium fumosum]